MRALLLVKKIYLYLLCLCNLECIIGGKCHFAGRGGVHEYLNKILHVKNVKWGLRIYILVVDWNMHRNEGLGNAFQTLELLRFSLNVPLVVRWEFQKWAMVDNIIRKHAGETNGHTK